MPLSKRRCIFRGACAYRACEAATGECPGDKIKPLNSEESAAFLEAARGERLEALYMLAIHCGLREGGMRTR
jgi:hypothetical protein